MSRREGTKFLWKIENFGCLKDNLLSPTFLSHSKTWELKICPLSDRKYISISLHKFGSFTPHFDDYLYCSLAFLKADGSPLIWKDSKRFGSEYWIHFFDFIERSEVFHDGSLFLPDRALTVMCLIWRNSDELVRPVKCFARTQFDPNAGMIEKSFNWTIQNMKSFSGCLTREELMGRNADPLKVQLSLNSEEEFEVCFTPSLYRIHLKVKISVMNVRGECTPFANSEFQFEQKEQAWKCKTNIRKTMLKHFRDLFLPNDTLSLQFICTQTGSITSHRMVDENEFLSNNPQPIITPNRSDHSQPIISPSDTSEPEKTTKPDSKQPNKSVGSNSKPDSKQPNKSVCSDSKPESKQPSKSVTSNSISEALRDMYVDGFLTDFVLKAGGKEFPVHKSFLGARSTVFKAMFTTEMRERDGNSVDIEDVDVDTLQKLLKFVYSDMMEEEDMGWKDASRLYTAADKYALESLKGKCSSILKSGLSASSALGVLKLSDVHHDQDMKSAALKFIERNCREIVGTKSWLKFEEENDKLALETFRNLNLKKVKG